MSGAYAYRPADCKLTGSHARLATRRCDGSVVHAHSASDMLGGSKRRDIDFRLEGA